MRGRGRAASRARVAAQRRSRGAAAAGRRAMAARRRRGHVTRGDARVLAQNAAQRSGGSRAVSAQGLQARHCAECALFARWRRRRRLGLAQKVVCQLTPRLALLQKRCSLRGSGATLESKLRILSRQAPAPSSRRCAMRAHAPRTARCACSSRARNASSCRLAGRGKARAHTRLRQRAFADAAGARCPNAGAGGEAGRYAAGCRARCGRRARPGATEQADRRKAGRALAPQPRLLRRSAQVL